MTVVEGIAKTKKFKRTRKLFRGLIHSLARCLKIKDDCKPHWNGPSYWKYHMRTPMLVWTSLKMLWEWWNIFSIFLVIGLPYILKDIFWGSLTIKFQVPKGVSLINAWRWSRSWKSRVRQRSLDLDVPKLRSCQSSEQGDPVFGWIRDGHFTIRFWKGTEGPKWFWGLSDTGAFQKPECYCRHFARVNDHNHGFAGFLGA